jgi:hypothetical protein
MAVMSPWRAAPPGAKNLMLLFEYARQFEEDRLQGPFPVHGMAEAPFRARRGTGVGADVSGGSVRIMSIHKSKGLEFRLSSSAILPAFQQAGSAEGCLFTRNWARPKFTDMERGVEYPRQKAGHIEKDREGKPFRGNAHTICRHDPRPREAHYHVRPEKRGRHGKKTSLPRPLTHSSAGAEEPAFPAHWLIIAALTTKRAQ